MEFEHKEPKQYYLNTNFQELWADSEFMCIKLLDYVKFIMLRAYLTSLGKTSMGSKLHIQSSSSAFIFSPN